MGTGNGTVDGGEHGPGGGEHRAGGERASDAARAFVTDLRRCVDDLRRLPAGRWRGRRDAAREVVQRWADLDADLEGEPRRPVPRLAGDPSLADQLGVVGGDLAGVAATSARGAEALREARADLVRLAPRPPSP